MNTTHTIWLDLAKSDLQASRILYFAENYRASYFMFQQAVEKANKAFGLKFNYITDADLRKISHNSSRIHDKINNEQLVASSKLKNLFSLYSFENTSLPFSFEKIEHSIENLESHENFLNQLKTYDLIKIKSKDVRELMSLIDEISDIEIKPIEKGIENYREIFSSMAELFEQSKFPFPEDSKLEIEQLFNSHDSQKEIIVFLNQMIPLLRDIPFVFMTLYITALITIQHVSSSRYPGPDFNPLKLYTKKLALVKHQPYFMDALDEAIYILKSFD